jgi:type IV pilus assembly protein PilM
MPKKEAGVWGIDLGQCALKAIRLEMIDGKVTATAFDYHEHPKILSQPDADPDQLVREALETFLSRNTLKGDKVIISVPGQSGLARFVKLPPVEEKKIGDIVRFEAKQQIPFPLEEVVWDFQKISAGATTDGFAMDTEIGLFAMKRDMVNRSLSQYQDVHIELDVIQMAPLALCNFVTYELLGKRKSDTEETGKKQCVVALDIGTDNSNLIITDGNRIIWQRPIPLGGNHFTRALTKDLKLTFAKAEHVKRNAIKSPDLRKILTALRPVLNDFVNEVQRSLGYFTNTHRDANILYMMGLGNAFRLPGLQKFLQEKLQLEVRKPAKFDNLDGDEVTTAPQFSENILSFSIAYGLALQGLGQTKLETNLLPQEIRTERKIREKKPWAAAAAAVLLIGIASMSLGMASQYNAYKNKAVDDALAQGANAKKEADDSSAKFTEIENQCQATKDSVNRIAAGVDQRFNWNLIYEYVNDCLPQPNGTKVTRNTRFNVPAYDYYYGNDSKAREAYNLWIEKQREGSKELTTEKKQEEEELNIKPHLIQVNIEGISCMYSDDLSGFFNNLKPGISAGKVEGLSYDERKNIESGSGLPPKGWVFEIRGYSFHKRAGTSEKKASKDFVVHTLVENLAVPEAIGVLPPRDAKGQWKKKWMDHKYYQTLFDPASSDTFKKRLSYVCLYKEEPIPYPEPGTLYFLNRSELPTLLTATAAKNDGGVDMPPVGPEGKTSRDSWVPIGEVASTLFGGGAGAARGGPMLQGETTGKKVNVARQSRIEFFILFVWEEPTLEGGGAAPPAGAPAVQSTGTSDTSDPSATSDMPPMP